MELRRSVGGGLEGLMRCLNRRLADLEASVLGGLKRWHCIIVRAGQTEEQATAAYEAEHGPIGEGNTVLRVIIRKPGTL